MLYQTTVPTIVQEAIIVRRIVSVKVGYALPLFIVCEDQEDTDHVTLLSIVLSVLGDL